MVYVGVSCCFPLSVPVLHDRLTHILRADSKGGKPHDKAKTATEEVPYCHEEERWWQSAGTGNTERWWSFFLWRYSGPAWMSPCVICCRNQLSAGGWARWSLEDPSNYCSCVILAIRMEPLPGLYLMNLLIVMEEYSLILQFLQVVRETPSKVDRLMRALFLPTVRFYSAALSSNNCPTPIAVTALIGEPVFLLQLTERSLHSTSIQ